MLPFSVMGQSRTGNIYGTIIDDGGGPLPGVTVTITGALTAPMTQVSNIEGKFRFLSLSPAKDYSLKAELQGFKTTTQENIIVTVGANVTLTIVMQMGQLQEEVTVTAQNPVVDVKRTSRVTNVTSEIMQSLPTARDVFTHLQLAPAITVDRENVGGNDAGNASHFLSHGTGKRPFWTMEGSETDRLYFDMDALEEMNISVGGVDVTSPEGALTINLVTKRGGNKMSLAGRFYIENERFQADNLTDELREEGIKATNIIKDYKDYGFNVGGPLVKDKAWFWLGYGVQEVRTVNVVNTKDDTFVTNLNTKLNIQLIPQNRFEIFFFLNNKEKFGRSSSYTYPAGWKQETHYHFGWPILKIQDEHVFGNNLYVSAKYLYEDSGFAMRPTGNEALEDYVGIWNVANRQWEMRAEYNGNDSRARNDVDFLLNYYNEKLFGLSHEIKAGFNISSRRVRNLPERGPYYYTNYNEPTVDITGDGIADIVPGISRIHFMRYPQYDRSRMVYALFAQDTMSINNFTVTFGIRYDVGFPKIGDFNVPTTIESFKDTPLWKDNIGSGTAEALEKVFPAFTIPGVDPNYSWGFFSPRIGITWNIGGSNKTVAKFTFGQYGDRMLPSEAQYFEPLGGSAWMNFWWLDDNGNGLTDFTEIYWHNSSTYGLNRAFDDGGNFVGDYDDAKNIMWGGFDPSNPFQTSNPVYTLDESAGSTRTSEFVFTLEHELFPDFGVSINLNYRKYDHFNWNLDYYPDTGKIESKSDYVQAGIVPSKVGPYDTGEGAGRPYYLLSADYKPSSYTYKTRQPDFYQKFYSIDLIFNKRLSNKWMMNGSFTLQTQTAHYGENGFLNPTGLWAIDGKVYAVEKGGGSGKLDACIFPRWMFKISGLYQFPYDINLSFTFEARDGHVVPEYIKIVDFNAPNPRYNTVNAPISDFGTLRLENHWIANFRIEKLLKMGDIGKVWIMLDVFNVFNNAMLNRRYDRNLGTYYPHDGSFIENPTSFMANEILNPRIFRIGIRFQF